MDKVIKFIKADKGGLLLLKDFEDIVDTTKVQYYEWTLNKNKSLTLKFYDSKRKLIKPYAV